MNVCVLKDRAKAAELQAYERVQNGLPAPGAKRRNGAIVPVCPSCTAAIALRLPWSCACGWSAETQPDLCPCREVRDIIPTIEGFAYDVSASYAGKDTAWESARASALGEESTASLMCTVAKTEQDQAIDLTADDVGDDTEGIWST